MSLQYAAWHLMSEADYADYIAEKSMHIESKTVSIASPFAYAVVYDDWSGLSPEDCDQLTEWLEGIENDYAVPPRYYITVDPDAERDFHRCEICGLMADCIDATININEA